MSRFCNKRPGYIKHGWVICKLNCACSSVLLKWLTLVICTLVATEFLIYIFENALLKWVFWMSRHTDLAQSWLRSSWRANNLKKKKKSPKGVWIVLVQRRTCMQLGCWSGSCEKGKKGKVLWGECVTSGDGLLKTSLRRLFFSDKLTVFQSASVLHPVL